MKKQKTETGRHRKLTLRREAIAELTPPQLERAVGGEEPGSVAPRCQTDIANQI